MHRIFFDTNEGSHSHGYYLHLRNSEVCLAAIGDELREGLHVIIYMPDELEMEAILKRDVAYDNSEVWIAIPVPGTIKYLDGSDQL